MITFLCPEQIDSPVISLVISNIRPHFHIPKVVVLMAFRCINNQIVQLHYSQTSANGHLL